LCGVASGLYVLWAYENKPGAAASAPSRWPADSALRRSDDAPTLVFVAHPQCTCTRASLDELEEILARAKSHPKTYVLFLKPSTTDASWEQTDLWQTASRLPGVTVIRDEEGREAARFGAATSGQTFLYDARGALLFSGGITGARGHFGDNDGLDAVVALVRGQHPVLSHTFAFGCALRDPQVAAGTGGERWTR